MKAISFKLSAIRKKQKVLTVFFLLLTAYSLQLTASYAQAISSTELIEKASEFDGKVIIYKGEAVTATLNRGEYSWVNLNDGNNAIGIWCKTQDLKLVKFIGDYKYKGDILEVVGTFNRACPLHGGELDIHATAVELVESGHYVKEALDKKSIYAAAAMFLLTLTAVVIFRKRL